MSGTVTTNENGAVNALGLSRTFLDNRFVYAVISQRAHGLSIGVNLNPNKYCNFDCVYCEVKHAHSAAECAVDVPVMTEELQQLLELARTKKLHELHAFSRIPHELLELKEVALSGDGEPTLCPNFEEVVKSVLHIRARLPFFKVVLITNTTGLPLPQVRSGLQLLTSQDEIWVKLDAGTEDYLKQINRPDLTLQTIMANILQLGRERPIVIQSLFPLYEGDEPSQEEIEQYALRLKELKSGGAQISLVQIYSAHRPAQDTKCGHLSLKTLSQIARYVRDTTGLKAQVF
jgi:wyosine [tRNA(Phe)-imidazoG37] synthetase (radical SAM superfamily)